MNNREQSKFDKSVYWQAFNNWNDAQDKRLAESSLGNSWFAEGVEKETPKAKYYVVNRQQTATIAEFDCRMTATHYRDKYARKCIIVVEEFTEEQIQAKQAQERERARFESTTPHRPLTSTQPVGGRTVMIRKKN